MRSTFGAAVSVNPVNRDLAVLDLELSEKVVNVYADL